MYISVSRRDTWDLPLNSVSVFSLIVHRCATLLLWNERYRQIRLRPSLPVILEWVLLISYLPQTQVTGRKFRLFIVLLLIYFRAAKHTYFWWRDNVLVTPVHWYQHRKHSSLNRGQHVRPQHRCHSRCQRHVPCVTHLIRMNFFMSDHQPNHELFKGGICYNLFLISINALLRTVFTGSYYHRPSTIVSVTCSYEKVMEEQLLCAKHQ